VRSKFWGLELIDANLPMPNHGHVILSSGPPILLYQIGTHETRALIDIPDHLPSAAPSAGGVKNHLQNVVLPTLPACVRPSFAAAIAQGRFRSMPNSFLPPSTQRTPGLILLGDAMNMRHPLTGGGMTVGFSDVLLLSKLLAPRRVPALEDTKAVARQMRTFHWRRKNGAAVINILAMALYSLFAADGMLASVSTYSIPPSPPPPIPPSHNHPLSSLVNQPNLPANPPSPESPANAPTPDAHLKTLQLGCFRYFQLGGACIDGPVGLLAGIIRQPFVLFYHFFAVAFYAIWLRVVAAPAMQKPWVAVVGGGAVLAKAVRVIGPYIVSEVRV
jgi:squalene monooxygenase